MSYICAILASACKLVSYFILYVTLCYVMFFVKNTALLCTLLGVRTKQQNVCLLHTGPLRSANGLDPHPTPFPNIILIKNFTRQFPIAKWDMFSLYLRSPYVC